MDKNDISGWLIAVPTERSEWTQFSTVVNFLPKLKQTIKTGLSFSVPQCSDGSMSASLKVFQIQNI